MYVHFRPLSRTWKIEGRRERISLLYENDLTTVLVRIALSSLRAVNNEANFPNLFHEEGERFLFLISVVYGVVQRTNFLFLGLFKLFRR